MPPALQGQALQRIDCDGLGSDLVLTSRPVEYHGTPYVHEHACTKCRFLRVDPTQLPRIEDMTKNAEDRLVEARERVWLGEVAGLEDSLKHLRQRQQKAERISCLSTR
jgi:hypothetical protein